MDSPDEHFDEWAFLQQRPDRFQQMLAYRDPHFDSAAQFGSFVALLLDQWRTAPDVDSWMGGVLDTIELGARVDCSLRVTDSPGRPMAYHLSWSEQVLEESLRTLQIEIDDDELPEEIFGIWGGTDIVGRSRRSVAGHYGRSTKTVQRYLRVGRYAVYGELVRVGRAEPQPASARRELHQISA